MGTEILKSFGTLQSELEQARSSLKGVDENIKRLIGRDPSDIQVQRPGVVKRGSSNNNNNNSGQIEDNNSSRRSQQQSQRERSDWSRFLSNRRVYSGTTENDEPPPAKKRSSVFNRLADRVVSVADNKAASNYDDEFDSKPNHRQQMISKIIVTPKEVPSRQDALDAQSKDEKSKARNRRMFGALLGTLQKFQQEETKLKSKEEKRAQVEKKIEESEIREKAEIKKERQELFFNRKKKQAEIKMIELKMTRMKEYSQWEDLQKPRMNFIMTKAKPHIHYLPRRLNEANKAALSQSKQDIEKMIDNKRQEVFNDLQEIEERMKRNFEPRKSKDDVAASAEQQVEAIDELLSMETDDFDVTIQASSIVEGEVVRGDNQNHEQIPPPLVDQVDTNIEDKDDISSSMQVDEEAPNTTNITTTISSTSCTSSKINESELINNEMDENM